MNRNESMNRYGPLVGAIDEGTTTVRFLVRFIIHFFFPFNKYQGFLKRKKITQFICMHL